MKTTYSAAAARRLNLRGDRLKWVAVQTRALCEVCGKPGKRGRAMLPLIAISSPQDFNNHAI